MNTTMKLYNQELENEIIGIFLLGGKDGRFDLCRRVLSPDDFSLPVCASTWRVFCEVYDHAQPINVVSTALWAQQCGIELTPDFFDIKSKGTDGDLTAYALEIHTLASKRRIITMLQEVTDNLQEHDYSVEDAATAMLKAIDREARATDTDIEQWKKLSVSVLKHVERLMNGNEPEGVFCGLRGFDAHGGLLPGDLDIIAGRTSQGKSSLALSIALGAALRETPVAIYSIEMPTQDLAFRLSAMISGISAASIERRPLSNEEFTTLYTALQPRLVAEAPIYFDRNKTSNIDRIIQSIRRMVGEVGIRVAVIDYAQLLTSRGRDEQRVLVGRAANQLKALAVELGITIILLSQLARPQRGGNNVPRLTELKESGELENAADNVFMVYRPEIYNESYPDMSQDWSNYDTHNTALIIRAKARKGPLGEFIMGFNGELTKFYDREQYDTCEQPQDEYSPF